jgi:hypothetical protein
MATHPTNNNASEGPILVESFQPKQDYDPSSGNEAALVEHGSPETLDANGNPVTVEEIAKQKSWFAYMKTPQFWLVILLGYA